ncbi:MAG TPA: putative oxidoreductase C-terminal domain-containing protein, partial [Gemmataceae bacterium]|nr:putative oxidoreductase C-terminal domain-containing protein [Gemmataceae bacterium]
MSAVRWITLDPAHFHAALVHKEIYPQVAPQVHVYAPLAPDLFAHLARIAGFNNRADQPTNWELEVHAGPDFLAQMLRQKPGNVVVLSGRNQIKIDYILAALEAGLHVLADKPWILVPEQLPSLQRALDLAETRKLVAYDIMTERHEITSILQRELINDTDIFGAIVSGSETAPAVLMESVHYLCKTVAGMPLRRPPWFFDVRKQGEGLSDVGTHLVDLVPWMLFPEKSLEIDRDLCLLSAWRWPTLLTPSDFQKVTGEQTFPHNLATELKAGQLEYFCNNEVTYRLCGIHVKLRALWDFGAAPESGDTHLAIFHGTKSRVEVRQTAEQKFTPELYVVPHGDAGPIRHALKKKVAALQTRFGGVGVEDQGARLRVTIPERFRVGHEAHFAEVTQAFLAYLANPGTLPTWEKPNLMAKYYVTTQGVMRGLLRGSAGEAP